MDRESINMEPLSSSIFLHSPALFPPSGAPVTFSPAWGPFSFSGTTLKTTAVWAWSKHPRQNHPNRSAAYKMALDVKTNPTLCGFSHVLKPAVVPCVCVLLRKKNSRMYTFFILPWLTKSSKISWSVAAIVTGCYAEGNSVPVFLISAEASSLSTSHQLWQ